MFFDLAVLLFGSVISVRVIFGRNEFVAAAQSQSSQMLYRNQMTSTVNKPHRTKYIRYNNDEKKNEIATGDSPIRFDLISKLYAHTHYRTYQKCVMFRLFSFLILLINTRI